MTREEAKSCIGTIEMLQRLAYNIHGVMDVIDADNCKKIIKALEQEPILDKIRAEIEGYKSTIDKSISEDELKIEGMKEAYTDCIYLIDKYKVEMRGNEE